MLLRLYVVVGGGGGGLVIFVVLGGEIHRIGCWPFIRLGGSKKGKVAKRDVSLPQRMPIETTHIM